MVLEEVISPDHSEHLSDPHSKHSYFTDTVTSRRSEVNCREVLAIIERACALESDSHGFTWLLYFLAIDFKTTYFIF